MRSGAIDVLVIDSVAALTPRAEIEGEMGDQLPGLQARLMSQALRKLTGSISRSNTMVIFINQIRMKIGVMFGSPETTTGGNALKFYASVRLDIRRIGAIKERDEVVGNQTRVKVVKNKLAPPFKQVEFDIMYGEGISKTGELIDLGVKAGIVEKSGAWFSYDSQRLGQGRENAKLFLKDNPGDRRGDREGDPRERRPDRREVPRAGRARRRRRRRRRRGRSAEAGGRRRGRWNSASACVTLGVADLDRSRRFYEDGLGWKRGNKDDGVVFFQIPGGGLRALVAGGARRGRAASTDSGGFGGIALAYNARSQGRGRRGARRGEGGRRAGS